MLLTIFGWDRWIRTIEMPESKSGALPLGYIPIFTTDELYHKKVIMSRGYFDINILFCEHPKTSPLQNTKNMI